MFLFTIYSFFFHITTCMSMGMGKGSNKLLHVYKYALVKGENPIYFTWVFGQERLPYHRDVGSSFKFLSQT